MSETTNPHGLAIETQFYPNPAYQYGVFRLNGVVIGRANKLGDGWALPGGRKPRTAQEIAVALLTKNIQRAQNEQRQAVAAEATARRLLRELSEMTFAPK